MVSTLESLASEYRALTEGCGLVDRAGRGRLALTGADRRTFLHGQVTNDIEGLEAGRGLYAALLTHKGKMLTDLRVLDLGDELLLSCERAGLQELFNMIRRYKLGSDVEVHKRTLEMGELSLMGPDEHDTVRAELAGHPVVLVATDLGVDAFCDAEATDAVRAALVAAGASEVAEAAAELVR